MTRGAAALAIALAAPCLAALVACDAKPEPRASSLARSMPAPPPAPPHSRRFAMHPLLVAALGPELEGAAPEAVRDRVIALLADEATGDRIRREAVTWLADDQDEPSAAALRRAYEQSRGDERVRLAEEILQVTVAPWKVGPRDGRDREALLTWCRTCDPLLRESSSHETPARRAWAATMLGHCGSEGSVALLAGLVASDAAPEVRRAAARALAPFVRADRRRDPLLAGALADSDDLVRVEAARALVGSPTHGDDVVALFAAGLRDDDAARRRIATEMLTAAGSRGAEAAGRVLLDASAPYDHRAAALDVLRKADGWSHDAALARILGQALADQDPRVRDGAAYALAVRGEWSLALPHVIDMAGASEDERRRTALSAMQIPLVGLAIATGMPSLDELGYGWATAGLEALGSEALPAVEPLRRMETTHGDATMRAWARATREAVEGAARGAPP